MQPPGEATAPDVEEVVEIEADAESAGAIPSAALAAHAAAARISRRRRADREILQLAWPVIASQALATIVSLVDIAMIGRLGTEALAAVGYATQFLMLAQSVLFAVGGACVALMARAIGAREPERARQGFAACLLLAAALAGLMTAVVGLAPRPLLRLLDARPAVIELAVPYLQLVVGSSMLLAVALVYESAFRAVRDTRTPLFVTGGVTLVKIALNGLLIFGVAGFPRLELVGAGLATVAAQVVALALFLALGARADRDGALRLRARDFRAPPALVREVLRISVPAVLERAILNLAIMEYFALLSAYGEVAIAAYTVGVRILSFSWIPGTGFAAAAATLVGQALGAGDRRGAARAGWRAARLAVLVSVVLGALYAAAREPIARVFTPDLGVIAAMSPFMLMLALAQPLMGVHFTLSGALRGAGDTWTPLVAAGAGNWGFRLPISWVFVRVLELSVVWVWAALIADHLARALWLCFVFWRGRWSERVGAATGVG
jgi:putative MATE family efflux protein